MTKRIIIKICLLVLIATFPLTNIGASSLTDLQAQREQLAQQAAQKKAEADQKAKEAQVQKQIGDDLNRQIDNISTNITKTEGRIADTEKRINDTEKSISETQDAISQKEKELAKQKNDLAETIRTIYETGQQGMLEVVISSNSLSDIIDHNTYLESLQNKIEVTIEEITTLKNDLMNKKTELEGKKRELDNYSNQQKIYKNSLEDQKNLKGQLMSSAKSREQIFNQQSAEATKMAAEARGKQSEIENQISAMIIASMKGKGKVQAKDRGTSAVGFQWPMDYEYITAGFGVATPFQSSHSGLDLANGITGNPIYAAADGTAEVLQMTYKDCPTTEGRCYYGYGNYIIIYHNARFATLYGHLQGFAVSTGSEVKRGQVIGYSGGARGAVGAGYSTGPHMHFEIRENGATINPLNYLP